MLKGMTLETSGELAPENYPLAWLVGAWQGGGILQYTQVSPTPYLHELVVTAPDSQVPYLSFTSKIWVATQEIDAVDKEASGQEVYQALTKDYLWSVANGFLRVSPLAANRSDGATEIEATLASPAGTAQIWFGITANNQAQLITEAVARSEAGAALSAAKIVTRRIGADLLYAYDMEAFGAEMQNYLAGKLSYIN